MCMHEGKDWPKLHWDSGKLADLLAGPIYQEMGLLLARDILISDMRERVI